ncbi:hypothetical protein PIB30_052234 [Stylosanthes scabra]|uniref:Uncharacterized protein n=1 Tax=Stylosanthes scabra TaxID=79078 RepID=A0ABU6SJA0_9FABA|nr:hypothetical protein [Stylosanthes scabra]
MKDRSTPSNSISSAVPSTLQRKILTLITSVVISHFWNCFEVLAKLSAYIPKIEIIGEVQERFRFFVKGRENLQKEGDTSQLINHLCCFLS